MILPITLTEYFEKLNREYNSMPDGVEKEAFWREIEKVVNKYFPSVKIEDVTEENSKEE